MEKAKIIFNLTSELHEDINDIYENMVDEDVVKARITIEEALKKLRALRENIKENE